MSIRKCIMVFSFSLLMFNQNLFSQITVQGVVADENSQPIHNALVEFIDKTDTTTRFFDYTDEQGQYLVEISETGDNDFHFQIPAVFQLLQNHPNPFNPATVIEYELAKPAHVTIEIYNVLGQKIRTLFDGFQSDLHGRIAWDATDDAGYGAAAGLYLYTLKANRIRLTRKMLLLDGNMNRRNYSATGAGNGLNLDVLGKCSANPFLLRVTGNTIETLEQENVVLSGSMVVNLTVKRATVTDIDGNVYLTVKIRNQWWMAENLKTTKYNNGESIPNVINGWNSLTTGAYCNYDNNEANVATYGRLYNWHAVNDSRNIAPEGWHVPSDEEWKQLEMNLGMSRSAADIIGYRGTDEGGKLKSPGTIEAGSGLWYAPNEGASNESGFSALPGGCRHYMKVFYGMGDSAFFWSSTKLDDSNAEKISIYSSGISYGVGEYAIVGFSVRCVRDN